jgi:hypothetical protein
MLPAVTGLHQVSQNAVTGVTTFAWDAVLLADRYAVSLDGTALTTVSTPSVTVVAGVGSHALGVAPQASPTPPTQLAFTVTASPFNVLEFGADPTGTKPSTAAFVKALAAAAVAGAGSDVYAPTGTYLIDASLASGGFCLELPASGLGLTGDGPDKSILELLTVPRNGAGGGRPEFVGAKAGIGGITVDGLLLDAQTHNTTYPFVLKDPDPVALHLVSSHNRVSNLIARSGTGFGVRFTGAAPCYTFSVGDNVLENIVLDTLSYGGGFVALDIDCQGNLGQWTYISNAILTGSMAIYLASFVNVDGLTFVPTKYQTDPCAPCIEITTNETYQSHDITIANVVSKAGKIRVTGQKGGTVDIANLVLPSGQYWAAGC